MDKKISNIVFTKNRPLQLHGYLESLYKHFPSELFRTYILYKPELFHEEYKHLFSKYSKCTVIKESQFHNDFLGVLKQINTKYLLFGIDDVIYFDSVDFDVIDETFNSYPDDIFGFSLRLGRNVVGSDKDEINDIVVKGQTVHKVNWNFGRTPNTRYPFELCATIYRTSLIKRIIRSARKDNPVLEKLFVPDSPIMRALGSIISTRSILKSFGYFFNPNTLESWNCRWCQNHSEQLPSFLYFQELCASAIQVNMVNTSTKNETCGSFGHTTEALAKKYKQGYTFDINFVEKNKPTNFHCGQEFFKLTRNWQMWDS